MAGYGTRNWKWPVWVCFGAEGKGKLWLARGENETEGKSLESGRRECWCCGRVSMGVSG